MPLGRVAGEHFGVLVDHSDGPHGRSCLPTPSRAICDKGLCCRPQDVVAARGKQSAPNIHQHREGHHGSVLPSRIDTVSRRPLGGDHGGPLVRLLWGRYLRRIPHTGCRLEIVATADATHPRVNLLLPGHVIRYKRSFFFGDRFELPIGVTVGLAEFVGFTLQLAPSAAPVPPAEELILERARHGEDVAGESEFLVPH